MSKVAVRVGHFLAWGGPRPWLLALLLAMTFAGSAHAQRAAEWRLVEEWRAGGEATGPQSLLEVVDIRLLADGSAVVLDAKEQRLHFFAKDGSVKASVGRKGAGPGEFRRASGLVVSPRGEIGVRDTENARLTLVRSNATLVRTVPLVSQAYDRPWIAFFGADGRLTEGAFTGELTPSTLVPARGAIHWDAAFGAKVEQLVPECGTVTPPEQLYYRIQTGDRGYSQFAYRFTTPRIAEQWIAPGERWVGVPPDYRRIHRLSLGKCELLASIQLDGRAIPVPAAQVRSERAMAARSGAGQGELGPKPERIREALPMYDLLSVDPQGQVWVFRYDETTAAVDERGTLGARVANRHRAQVFSRTGAFLAELRGLPLLGNVRPAILGDRVLMMTVGEDDIPWLVSYRVQR